MKKLLYLIATALVMHACIDDENIVDYKTYPFSVQLVYPDGYAAREGIPVHLLNTTTGVAFDTITDAAGRASFIVAPGIYELSTTDKRPDIGGIVNILNGARNNIAITALSNTSAPYQLPMTLSRAGQVIVKELYIGGCPKDDGSGTFQMDKYAILYNNSEYAASLDSVAFGMIYPYNANNTNAYYDANGNLAYENAGWVPAGSGFWYFPNIVSLQPGEQIVVAINGAIDNTATYSQSVNLANENYYCMYDIADFNNVLYHPSPSTLIPASHYLLAYRFALGNSWVLSTNSPCFIIFTPKGVSLREFTNDAATTDPESGTTLTRKMLPTDWILDGVEVYRRGYDNNLKRAPA
ncbi:MAG: DUF4876 domain-containing protein, partial [Odoribacteraceae bacterium]|nr:DUF4876 domain-containing protein [Odoribacteraceae bacterium]